MQLTTFKLNVYSSILLTTVVSIYIPLGGIWLSTGELFPLLICSAYFLTSKINIYKFNSTDCIFLLFLFSRSIGALLTEGITSTLFIRFISQFFITVSILSISKEKLDSKSLSSLKQIFTIGAYILSICGVLNHFITTANWSEILASLRLIPGNITQSTFDHWYNAEAGIISLFPVSGAYAFYLTFFLYGFKYLFKSETDKNSLKNFITKKPLIFMLLILNLLFIKNSISLVQVIIILIGPSILKLFYELPKNLYLITNHLRINKKILIILPTIIFLILFNYTFNFFNQFYEFFNLIITNFDLFTSDSISPVLGSDAKRIWLFVKAIEVIAENPIRFFSGFSIEELTTFGYYSDPHNWFLSTFLRQGFFSLIFLLSFFIKISKDALKKKNFEYLCFIISLLVIGLSGGPFTDIRILTMFLISYRLNCGNKKIKTLQET